VGHAEFEARLKQCHKNFLDNRIARNLGICQSTWPHIQEDFLILHHLFMQVFKVQSSNLRFPPLPRDVTYSVLPRITVFIRRRSMTWRTFFSSAYQKETGRWLHITSHGIEAECKEKNLGNLNYHAVLWSINVQRNSVERKLLRSVMCIFMLHLEMVRRPTNCGWDISSREIFLALSLNSARQFSRKICRNC